jgi:predicted hydrocarbon binding protein
MASEAIRTKRLDEHFWRDLPSMTDYFGPAVSSLQSYLGVGSKEIMFHLGAFLGEKAANQDTASSPEEMLKGLARVWDKYEIGHLEIASLDPVALVVTDCRICGQLSGTGDMYECAFHEGFFQGALSAKLGKPVEFHQETNYAGTAGMWCRRLTANVSI